MELWFGRTKKGADSRDIRRKRMAGVVLNPLTEIGVGMFVPVMVRLRQLMVNGQRGRERSNDDQQQCHGQRDRRAAGDPERHPTRRTSHTGDDY